MVVVADDIIIYLAIMIIAAVVAVALAPKPPSAKPPSITDFELPTAEENRSIPVVFGTVLLTGPNVIWYGDYRTTKIVSSSGK